MSDSTRTVLIVGAGAEVVEALESSYARAFEHLGFKVYRWNPAHALAKVARFGRFGKLFSTFVNVEPWMRKSNLELLSYADELHPNLILIIATHGVRPGTLAQIRVRLPDCLIYCIYPDSPHNLDADRILSIPFFDRICVSSPAWVESWRRLGANHVSYLPFAADTYTHYLAPNNSNSFSHRDLAFVGTWRIEREIVLEQLSDFDLIIWGSHYWKSRTRPSSPLRASWAGRSLKGNEFALACAHYRIMLNIVDPSTYPGPNMRTFEQAACGAFSLVTRTPAVLDIFKEGETIECFDTIEEVRSKISYYLSHEDARQRITAAAYQLVTEQHTYIVRVKQITEWMQMDYSG